MNMHKARLICVVVALMLTSACGRSESEPESVDALPEATAAVVIDQARAAYELARQKQHAWTLTADLIESASIALANNDEAQALVDAKRALFTANASLAQAEKEQHAWRSRVAQ
jgi:hypothetical protein